MMKKTLILLLTMVFLVAGFSLGFAAPADTPAKVEVTAPEKVAAEPISLEDDKPVDKAADKSELKKPPRKPFTVATIMLSEEKKDKWGFSTGDFNKKFIAAIERENVKVVPYNTASKILKKNDAQDYFKDAAVLLAAKELGADYVVVVQDYVTSIKWGKENTWTSTVRILQVADGTVLLDNPKVTTTIVAEKKKYNVLVDAGIKSLAGAVNPILGQLATM